MLSRLYYLYAKMKKTMTIEDLERFDANMRKYGVDTCDEDVFWYNFKGELEIRNLLYEQLDSVLRVLWNQCITVKEVGEQVYNEATGEVEDYVAYHNDDDRKSPGMSDVLDAIEKYALTKDLPVEDSEQSDDEDDDPEDDDDE